MIGSQEGSLGSSEDYRLMRSLLPARQEESVFCFLSEALFRHLVGPRLRILESRRCRCASRLRTITNACLLYLEEKGQKPESLEPLFEGGYLEKGKVPRDPWDSDYVYLSPGLHGDFDLISYGPDGEPGGEGMDKDINNWELE